MKNLILTAIIVLLTSTVCKAQQIKFPESFILGKQDFLKSQTFISTKLLSQSGVDISKNPDTTENKEVISKFVENFNLEDIDKVYFEIYGDKINQNQESISIAVLEFKTVDKLKNNLQIIDKTGLFTPIYFVVNNYIIVIRGENRPLIQSISNFYSKKLGAEYYSPEK